MAEVGGAPKTYEPTALGRELHVDLLMTFFGMWHPLDVPYHLDDYGLMEEEELVYVYESDEDLVTLLMPIVRRAYFDYWHRVAHTC